MEFDHLISKSKLSDEDNFEDFINPVTKHEVTAVCDPYLRTVSAGDVIQLERKGFYRVDSAFGSSKGLQLFYIPDGRLVKSLAERLKALSTK